MGRASPHHFWSMRCLVPSDQRVQGLFLLVLLRPQPVMRLLQRLAFPTWSASGDDPLRSRHPNEAAPGMGHVRSHLRLSERHAGRALKPHRSMPRNRPRGRAAKERPATALIELPRQSGQYACRRITARPRDTGWQVNDTPAERLCLQTVANRSPYPQTNALRNRQWTVCLGIKPCKSNLQTIMTSIRTAKDRSDFRTLEPCPRRSEGD